MDTERVHTRSINLQCLSINRFFEDDFSNIAATSENFLGNGESYRGLTVVQDVEKGEFTLEGLYTGDPDDSNHRWVDISKLSTSSKPILDH